MSNISSAPTSSAIFLNGSGSRRRGYDVVPATIIFGRCSSASVADLVHVDAVLGARAVGDEVVEQAAGVHRRAVGEMATVVEAEAEHGVARLEQRLVDAHVGVGTRVRLHVRVVGAEQRLHPVDRELFDRVDDRVAAVVPLARIALGVLVGEHRAGRGHHRRRGEVLARDQLEAGGLALDLALDEVDRPRCRDRCRWGTASVVLVGSRTALRVRSELASSAVIWSTRRWWRPPSNSVVAKRGHDLLGEARRRRPGHPSTARWRRCVRGPSVRCRGSCTARHARRAPCWRRAARPGRCRRARCRQSASPSTTVRPTPAQIAG